MNAPDGKSYAIDGQPLDMSAVPAGQEYVSAYTAADRMATREDRPIMLTVNGQRVTTAHPSHGYTTDRSETFR